MSLSSVMALQQVGADQVNYWAAFPLSSPTLVENVVPSNLKVDEVFPSGDDASIKVRKPYTITKQRERWTEEEHQKFLDALKLYGRAWRRIEEHIGTKTAVQIRSHAQKFFSKLEREASLGGSMTSTGPREIEIPPPRPKRKPNHPYPKKASGALSNSPSFEEDTKSPSAVCSAFTPLENSLGAATSTLPSKKTGSAAGSLRLFGQTFVQGFEKPEVDNELMESTGSPRSQVSLEVEETSGVSLVGSNPAAIPWDQSTLVSNVNEPAIVDSISQGPSKFSEWERKLLAANGSGMLGAYHFAQSIPPYWQAFLPSHYVHATKDGANTTAAIAAATYAIASAWQAIQGALITNVDNNTNASIVYNPTAILAAAGKPISFSMPVPLSNEQLKREPAYNCHEGRNESEDPPVNLEESTAECCSGLTDSSRLSSYESNDEMIPSPKRQRKVFSDTIPLCNKSCDSFQNMECEQPLVLDTISSDRECPDHLQEQTNLGVRSSSTEGCVTEGKNSTQNLSDEVTQSVDGKRQTTALDAEQPLNLISEECAPHLSPGNEEPSAKARESFKESNDSDKESEASFSGCNEVRNNSCKGRIVHPVQVNVSGTQIKSGNHLFALKAGAPSSRYSGVGFVPYRKSNTSNSGSKHDYQCGPNLGILR